MGNTTGNAIWTGSTADSALAVAFKCGDIIFATRENGQVTLTFSGAGGTRTFAAKQPDYESIVACMKAARTNANPS